jgi:hypothetical protein
VPFLGEPKTEPPAPPPFQQTAGNAPAEQNGQPQAAGPAKKDLSPEVIYFAQKYSPRADGITLENRIYEDAAQKKGNINKSDWKAREKSGGLFELACVIPMLDGSGPLAYRYEVDYPGKTIKPMDKTAARPIDLLIKGPAPSKQPRVKNKQGRTPAKGRPQAGQTPARAAGQERTKAAAPAAAPADEEYEYVYEDDPAATGE